MTHFNRSVEERIGAHGAFCPLILRKPAVDPACLKSLAPQSTVESRLCRKDPSGAVHWSAPARQAEGLSLERALGASGAGARSWALQDDPDCAVRDRPSSREKRHAGKIRMRSVNLRQKEIHHEL